MKRFLVWAGVLLGGILPLRAQDSDPFAWKNATVNNGCVSLPNYENHVAIFTKVKEEESTSR